MKVEQITGPDAEHGEGACWHASEGTLLWVDMLAGDVLGLADDGSVDRWHVDTVAALVRPRVGGGLVIAGERRLLLAPAYGEDPTRTVHVVDDPDLRFNEGAIDPAGHVWCGTTSWSDTTGTGTLYRFDQDLTACPVLSGVSVSNGLAWATSGDRVYYADSATGGVDVFEPTPDGLAGRRRFITFDEPGVLPDGLCLDREGGVWVAAWAGGAVLRFDAAGRLSERIEIPARLVTSCTFGGPDLTDLYVTTSRVGEPSGGSGPGSLFRVATDVVGVPSPLAAL